VYVQLNVVTRTTDVRKMIALDLPPRRANVIMVQKMKVVTAVL